MASREVDSDLGQLSKRVDHLRDEMRIGFQDVRTEVRALRLRVDTMLLAMVALIATLALKS